MKPLVVANWKCNPTTLPEAKKLFNSVKKGIKNVKNTEIVICPPFIYLSNIRLPERSEGEEEAEPLRPLTSNFQLGAQDCFWEEKGAFTGEVSPKMLKDLGCQYVIIGHSERREYFKETDEIVNKKLKAVLSAGLKAILCVDNISQIKKDLAGLIKKELSGLIIAYEPLFAIGTGKSCSIEKADKMRKAIKKKLLNKKNPILYGGSVNSQNAAKYIKKAGFQGLLIGGASLNSKEFLNIIQSVDFL